MASIDVELKNVSKVFDSRRQDAEVRAVDNISLQIESGEFFALLGPSGCGKTTTLRMIAGFEDTSSGEILIRGKAVQNVPPFHRPVNTVFQDYALFPHMSVLKNVMFGLEMEGVPRAEAESRAREALQLVRLPQQAVDRKPRQLSGGQQQRVALARALVKRPAVLLLDEPLAALDLKLRQAMRYELKSMQKSLGVTFIFVTHDQEEAMTMADRIAVMDQGKVLQVGTPEEIYETPTTQFVADFIGETNFFTGEVADTNGKYAHIRLDEQHVVKAMPGAQALSIGQKVTVALRPEKVNLFSIKGAIEYDEGSSESVEEFKRALLRDPNINLVRGRVHQAIYIGTDTRYRLRIPGQQEIVARVQNFGLKSDTWFDDGEEVNVYWNAENARILLS